MDLDMNVAEMKDLEIVAEGIYPALIKDVKGENDQGKKFEDKNGNQFLKISFAISEGEFAGRVVFGSYFPLTGDGAWQTKQMCENLGMNGKITNTLEFLGKACKVKVKNEMYKERMQSPVVGVLPAA